MQEERAPPGKPGTPQKPAASKASEVRGNSNGDRRHSRRDEEDGQPSESDAGSASGSGDGATWNRNQGSAGRSRMRPTRNLIDRQRWSMHDPMSDRITVRRRQRPQGFWRFRLWGGWYPTLNWSDDQFRMGHPVYGGSATNLEWGTRYMGRAEILVSHPKSVCDQLRMGHPALSFIELRRSSIPAQAELGRGTRR